MIFSNFILGQTNWLRSYGGLFNEEMLDATVDSNGDLVFVGYFSGTLNTGVGTLNTYGNSDIIVMKTDDNGDAIWAVNAGGGGTDKGHSITADNLGNTYITGFFQTSATFGTINVTGTGWEAFVAKIDQNGNFLWVTTFGGPFGDIGYGIDVDNTGNVYCVGQYKGSAIFGSDNLNSMIDPTTGNPSYDVFITKLDPSGNFLWTRDGNAKYDDRPLSVSVDDAGSCYVVGEFSDTITFDVMHPNTVINAGFMISYDAAGNEQWFDRMWGGLVSLKDVQWQNDKVFITGDFVGNILVEDINDINNFPGGGDYNILVARFDDNGDLNWLSSNYSDSELHSNQLTIDANNDIYITGDFNCTFTEMNALYGNSTFLSLGFEDIHYLKYNYAGTFQWARQVASKKSDFCSSIIIQQPDFPIIAGSHENTFFVPAGDIFNFLPGQNAGASSVNCGDNNYGIFAKESNSGQRDIFITNPFDINRLPFDYYEKDPDPCDLDIYDHCIGNVVDLGECEDTLADCNSVTAGINDFFIDGVAPNVTYLWSTGSTASTQTFAAEGTYSVVVTSEDQCYTWTDDIYIYIYPNPDPPLITDNWGYNYLQPPYAFAIDTCDADSLLVWASPSDTSTIAIEWGTSPGSQNVNDTTILVNYSDTYYVSAINSYGCYSTPNAIDVTLDNFAIHDTLDPYIIFSDPAINETDSVATCEMPHCLSAFLIDSAFINMFGTIPDKYSVWYLDGVLVDTLWHDAADSISIQNPSIMNFCVTDTGWHNISVELVNECGDTVNYNLDFDFYVQTIQPPVLVLDGPLAPCPGDTVTVTATFFADTIIWSGSTIIANYGDSVDVFYDYTTGLYLSAMVDTTVDSTTCNSSAFYIFSPIPPPQVTLDPLDGTICPGDSVLLTVDGGLAWQWIGPGGDSLGTSISQYASDVGEYFCYVSVNGCTVQSEFATTNAYSSPTLFVGNPIICLGDSTEIEVLGPSATVINWLPPLSGSASSIFVSDAGWYYCEMTYCDITTLDSVEIFIDEPIVDLGFMDTTVCPNGPPVVLTGPSGMVDYIWNDVSTGLPNYTVPDSGSYYLEVINANGCPGFSDTVQVNYFALPNPPAALDTTICPGSDADLYAIGPGTITWYEFNGTFIQTGVVLSLTNVPAPISYLVTVTDANCESLPDTSSISFYPDAVIADFVIIDQCGSLDVQVQNTGTTGVIYDWNMGDGAVYSGAIVNHSYAGNGTYTIQLTVTDPICGYTATTSQDVTVYGQSVTPYFNSPTCYGFSDASLTLNLTAGQGDETFIILNSSGAQVNTGGSNTANNLTAGWYFWEVVLGPGCSLIDSTEITGPGEIDVDLNLTNVLCNGEATGIAEIDTVYNWQGNYNNISFFWNPNPSGVGGIWADSAYNMVAGQYTLTVNDDNGCSSVIDFWITEPEPLVFVEIGTDPAYCRTFFYQSGNGVVYAAASGGTPDYSYQWTNLDNGDTSQNTTWGGLNPGNYQIIVTDNNGCQLIQTLYLDSLNPIADFDMTSLGFDFEWEGMAPLNVHFVNQSLYYANPNNPNADTTFFWNFNYDTGPWVVSHDIGDAYDTIYAEAGTYTVCLVAINKNACTDTLCQDIVVYDPAYLHPPNIFTPDGDGINDVFTFTYLADGITQFECVIVDRWGVVIIEFDDIHDVWDGKNKKGELCPDGVYFYVYKGSGDHGESFEGQGSITLVNSGN